MPLGRVPIDIALESAATRGDITLPLAGLDSVPDVDLSFDLYKKEDEP